jgi:hypothetical protein
MSMDADQIGKWRAVGLRTVFEVIAPCMVVLSNGSTVEATALVKVGPPKGMVVDPEWSVLEPHAEQLVADGFGFSAVTIGDDDLGEMLRDWGGGNDR